ncbi:MalM family protein [Vibrio ezurae]|uniref:MalM protein n=1 Tax=Vibrio ezurae NBRC 102218 TaxID=1219080 RepID=U3AJL6_9VIBR|nr:MalM family protein [Vibrio ezurae]GAD80121.1 MalM protein [Vibrio ezurae NBRC 102218]
MKLRALFLSCCVALTGCATQEALHQVGSEAVVTSVASLNTSQFKLDTQALVTIDKYTQVLSTPLIDSPVVAFDIPSDRGPLDISITSNMTNNAFFSPEVLIVDHAGNVIDKYDASEFEYRRPRLAWGDRLVAEFRLTPPVAQKTVTMLIYTTAAELAKTTDRIHPARAMAEGKGNYLPEVKDIPTPHVSTGQLLVEVKGADSGLWKNEETHQLDATVEKSTQEYYYNAIRKAVDEDNMPKALTLLDEAKELQIKGAQQVYIDALETHRSQ